MLDDAHVPTSFQMIGVDIIINTEILHRIYANKSEHFLSLSVALSTVFNSIFFMLNTIYSNWCIAFQNWFVRLAFRSCRQYVRVRVFMSTNASVSYAVQPFKQTTTVRATCFFRIEQFLCRFWWSLSMCDKKKTKKKTKQRRNIVDTQRIQNK